MRKLEFINSTESELYDKLNLVVKQVALERELDVVSLMITGRQGKGYTKCVTIKYYDKHNNLDLATFLASQELSTESELRESLIKQLPLGDI